MTEAVYTKIPSNLKEKIKVRADGDGQTTSAVISALLEDGLETDKLRKLVSELQNQLAIAEEREEYPEHTLSNKKSEELEQELEPEAKPSGLTGVIPARKSIDLTNHKAMLDAGLFYCPTCSMDLKSGKDLKQMFTENLRKVWNERKYLTAVCRRCGFPVKSKDHDGFTEKTEDVACPICGSTQGKERDKPDLEE